MLCKKNIMIINTSVSRVWITIFSMILLLEWLPCVCFFLIAPQFLSLTPFIPSKPLPNFFKGNINLLSMEQVLIFSDLQLLHRNCISAILFCELGKKLFQCLITSLETILLKLSLGDDQRNLSAFLMHDSL